MDSQELPSLERGSDRDERLRTRDAAGNEGVGQAAVAGKTVRKYYALGGRRVAMRVNKV